ncbi:MAG: LPS export ABC transporter periplasmic protein LptC [Rhodospirillaceae bacterium]|nr:LPS export ABC transporter periplasmic protein LptC [Rhodospirillaceae bacterium]
MSASHRYGGTPPPRGPAPPRLAGLQARSGSGAAGRTVGYSNFVGIMRYGLPLVALLLLGLVIVWPLATGREEGFRISFSDAPDLDGSLRMVNARYLGVDDRNQPFTVTAAEASQSEPNSPLVALEDISADVFIDDGSGQWFALTAREGLYERDARFLDLAGDVSIFSDQGHEFHTERAHVDLGARTAEGDAPVQGQSPLGLLEAGNFHVDDDKEIMLFGGGVKMTIFPGGRG